MKYSIWLEPSAKDKKYLQKIIRDLARKRGAPAFSPHVTLYSGIKSIELAKKAVSDCRNATKLKVIAGDIKHSENLWKTLYVVIRPSKKLSALNRILKKRLDSHVRYQFRPHLSLIYKKMPSKTKRQIAKDLSIKRTLEFDRISIIRSSNKVRNWASLAKIPLK